MGSFSETLHVGLSDDRVDPLRSFVAIAAEEWCRAEEPAIVSEASDEHGRSERDDKRPRNDAAEIAANERFDVIESPLPIALAHHLCAGVGEHEVPVLRRAVRLVPVVAVGLPGPLLR
jgi:hypothetical protein